MVKFERTKLLLRRDSVVGMTERDRPVKVTVPRDKLKSALRDDAEFRVLARYWSGSLRFDIGGDV